MFSEEAEEECCEKKNNYNSAMFVADTDGCCAVGSKRFS